MNLQKNGNQTIDAILFDMNGTLRIRVPHEPTQRIAISRFFELLGKRSASDVFLEEISNSYRQYNSWAQENLLQLSEKEIWTRWLLPGFPSEQVEPVAEELTLAFKERKGHCIPVIGAYEVLVELKQRGYLLGLVSNTISSLDIPRSLETFGWNELFHTVILSSAVKFRKPSPEIFWEATSSMNMEPTRCAYLGNRISRDMVGCKRAGFALGILIEPQGKPHPGEKDQKTQPDVVISSLSELLALFP